ncbi:multispanning membrane protein [Pseudozyma hubeiensis SY62]|uniref:Multispanning membrane protein n=1 Tax=Pseudozyma hubeiensis (strain SY62) TaxID=1305764 RepID=R9PBZ0_PSEHS|nr:multispanning membrane protein [Pseudozyma hubeiensis SY62]GAC98928.1 multispanning membrane protein [Pseudozyma hubeiensis SY62]
MRLYLSRASMPISECRLRQSEAISSQGRIPFPVSESNERSDISQCQPAFYHPFQQPTSYMISQSIIAICAVLVSCVVSVSTNATNVVDNHRLFSGRIPHPQLFGISGYVASTTVGAGGGEGLKIFPDLANAEGTGSHVDWTWRLHGIPSYLYTEHNLSSADLERNSYRIVQDKAPDSDSDARPSYTVVLASASTVTLDKRTDCLVRDTPPASCQLGSPM